jgi:hypothetical protein
VAALALLPPTSVPVAPSYERFDMNIVSFTGTVLKIRPFNSHHVLVHLRASTGARITLALPESHDISLLVGETVTVQGWLEDVPYDESFAAFLQRAGQEKLLEQYPELAAIRNKTIQRSITVISPINTQGRLVDEGADQENFVRLEGLVVRTWVYSDNIYARLAFYDEHAVCLPGGSEGLPRRQARYATVQFTDCKVDGRELKIGKQKSGDVRPGVICRDDRIRISGRLKDRTYAESMHDWVERARCEELFTLLPNAERLLNDVRARYGQVVIEATRLIQFG